MTNDARLLPVARNKRGAWIEWTVFAVGVTLLTLFDVATSGAVWQAVYFPTVAVFGVLALRGRVGVWALGLVSMAATAAFRAFAVTTGVPGTFGLGECFLLLVVIVVSSRRAAGWAGWLQVALSMVALLCVPLRISSPDLVIFVILLVAGGGCALAAGAVLKTMDAERRLALAVAAQNERDGLARDLHDDFTNRVTGMILSVQAMRVRAGRNRAGFDGELAQVEAAGAEALASMRRWVATLRESTVERNPELSHTALTDVPFLLRQWQTGGSGRRVEFINNTYRTPPEEMQTTVYRIVQEAVTNVSRHTPNAGWLTVSISEENGRFVLLVVNPVDGTSGVDPVPGSGGLGLIGMRERAQLVDGVVHAGPGDNLTWKVHATFPVSGAAS